MNKAEKIFRTLYAFRGKSHCFFPSYIKFEFKVSLTTATALYAYFVFTETEVLASQREKSQRREEHEKRIFIFTVSVCCSKFPPVVGSRGLTLWIMVSSQYSLTPPLLQRSLHLHLFWHLLHATKLQILFMQLVYMRVCVMYYPET